MDAYAQLALNEESLGQYDKSLENLDKAIRLSPHDPSLRYWYAGKATAYFALNHYEEAIEWARRAIAIEANYLTELRNTRRGACVDGATGRRPRYARTLPCAQRHHHHNHRPTEKAAVFVGTTIRRGWRTTNGSSRACARRGCRRNERDPKNRGDPRRRRGRLQPARRRGRGSHLVAAAGAAQRSDRSRHRRASRAHRQADRRRQPDRVPQRGRRGALRHRGAERPDRAQRRVPPERRIEFRVGIHLGDVVEESRRRPDGRRRQYRCAARGHREPGAICLSEDAYRQVKGRLDLAVTDLGPTQLKNIAEPVRVYSLEVGKRRRRSRPAQSKRRLRSRRLAAGSPRSS